MRVDARADILQVICAASATQYGRNAHSVERLNPDFEALALAVGASYALVDGDPEPMLRECVQRPGVTLVELRLGDSAKMHALRTCGLARGLAQRALGPGMAKQLKRLLVHRT